MAGIIKSGQVVSQASAVRSAVFNLEDWSRKADAYLEVVRQQGAQLLHDAQQQAARLRAAAQQEGRQAAAAQAEQAARAAVTQRLETLTPALESAIRELGASRDQWCGGWEKRLLRLAIAIAERIVRRELQRAPEISLDWVREALELATQGGRVRVYLNPADRETLGEHIHALVEQLERFSSAEVLADPGISPGGCRVVTESGELDQQLESQLRRMAEELDAAP